jgi:peptide/nickel transport system substrate-binding protein
MKIRRRRTIACLAAAVALVLGAAACTEEAPPAKAGELPVLEITGTGGGPAANFNPFLPTSALNAYSAVNMIYEPLVQFNILKEDSTYPWLATAWTWADGDKTLTFKLRDGVNWSDGQPFTSADVVFTFELIKKYAALNVNGVDFQDITAPDDHTVVISFAKPAYTQLYAIAGLTPIVSKHEWEKVPDPTKFLDPNPIGTGPFVYKSYNPQLLVLTRNEKFWQPGKPEVQQLNYHGLSFETAGIQLLSGELDWADYFFTTGSNKEFVNKNKDNHFWYPPTGVVSLVPNHTVWPLSELPVRQAISAALDRQQICDLGQYTFNPPVKTPTGLLLPNYDSALDPKYKDLQIVEDKAKAKQLLEQAGFTLNKSGIYEKGGRPISLTLTVPSGYKDWMNSSGIIAQQLKTAGIAVTVKGVSVDDWSQRVAQGHYDLTLGSSNTGASPFVAYQGWLDYSQSGPVGQNARGNVERFNDPATQKLLTEYQAAGTDEARLTALRGLQAVMVEKTPIIPLVYSVDWAMYRSAKVTGWPTEADPYAPAAPYTPGAEIVVLRLKPTGQ